MLFFPYSLMALLLVGPENPQELRVDAAVLTLIEHADLSASDAGLLSRMTAKEGEIVAQGSPLAMIDERDARIVLSRADTELKVARSIAENDIKLRFAKLSVAVANAELARAIESNARVSKSVSQTEIDRLKLLADKAVLEIEQAEFEQQQAKLSLVVKQQELQRATLALERRSIVAPFPGMVVTWKKQLGEWIEPGAPVMRLIRLNRLRAEAFVPSTYRPSDLIDRSATFLLTTPDKKVSRHVGKLVFVNPEIDPVNGQARVWAEIENEDSTLRPGQAGALVINLGNPKP